MKYWFFSACCSATWYLLSEEEVRLRAVVRCERRGVSTCWSRGGRYGISDQKVRGRLRSWLGYYAQVQRFPTNLRLIPGEGSLVGRGGALAGSPRGPARTSIVREVAFARTRGRHRERCRWQSVAQGSGSGRLANLSCYSHLLALHDSFTFAARGALFLWDWGLPGRAMAQRMIKSAS